jgi:hypothetical protein
MIMLGQDLKEDKMLQAIILKHTTNKLSTAFNYFLEK